MVAGFAGDPNRLLAGDADVVVLLPNNAGAAVLEEVAEVCEVAPNSEGALVAGVD